VQSLGDVPLGCLIYVSSAQKALRYEELDSLLTEARERNQQLGLTGVLLYLDQTFMQYIEGPLPICISSTRSFARIRCIATASR